MMTDKPRGAGPTVAIAEPHYEFAGPLEDVVSLAGCTPLTVTGVDCLQDLPERPEAIVVRVAAHMPHASAHDELFRLASSARPMIVALASSDADAAEAERLQCDVVVRAPRQIQGLYQVLAELAARGATRKKSA